MLLKTEQRGSVLLATLNRPERRNALGSETMAAFAAMLETAELDNTVRVVVLAAAAPAFCAGSDLKELGGLSISAMRTHEAETARVARLIARLPKPIMCAVEGYALGGGFILATSCDVVVTASNTRWHLPEVQNGWLPPWGLQSLVARVGPVRARLLTWGAEPIDGTAAATLGVADYVVDPGQALDRALALAASLAALPAHALASTKRYFEPMIAAEAERLDELAGEVFAADCESDEAKSVLSRFGQRA